MMSTHTIRTFDGSGNSFDTGENERTAAIRARARLDRMLDQALEDTFPASDPVSIAVPSAR
jgi:hypothetical protein